DATANDLLGCRLVCRGDLCGRVGDDIQGPGLDPAGGSGDAEALHTRGDRPEEVADVVGHAEKPRPGSHK
ncbi:MAG: hypothetical protein RI976_882, partial [Actinomycetota bacterium]